MTFVADIFESKYPVILFESKYRILKLLLELGGYSGSGRIKIVVGRELTKKFEEIIRGDIESVKKHLEKDKQKIAGEFVIVIYKEK